MRACAAQQMSGPACGERYLPGWLNDGPDVRYSPAQLQAMTGELTRRIMPLWTSICEKGKQAGDAQACDME